MSAETATTPSNNKLYVGNIEYSTTKEELKELFKDYLIESIQIPTRSPRTKNGKRGTPKSKGYVFITFAPEVKDLDSIIKKFTDYEFKDRKIYLSHPAPKEESSNDDDETKKADETKKTDVKKSSTSAPKPKKTITKKEKIPFEKGTKSNDTIYLKNLDFQTSAKELRDFFTEEGEEVRWVSVPFKRLPQFILKKLEDEGKLIKKNKGFAFVKFKLGEDEKIDDKVAKYQGKLFKERELQISVAVDVRHVEEGEADEGQEEATSA